MNAAIHIGTSSWHYDHWKGPFYPLSLHATEMLAFYAERFRSVEINNSFYHLPEPGTLAAWRDAVDDNFLFAVKASRYITHMKKLKAAGDAVQNFFERISLLGQRLGPVLFQLPPRWHCNPARLKEFLALLPTPFRYAFEFRDPSWFTHDVYKLLEEAGAAFCIYELAGVLSPKAVTADFVYVRLHGPDAAYQGSYSTQTLAGWAGAISTWAWQGREVFCYFDNDQSGYAAANAASLASILGA